MKNQIWIGDGEPTPDQIEPVENPDWTVKPLGGFWTSSETAEGESAWTEWCRREEWWNSSHRHMWRLTPIDNGEVLEVTSIDDLQPYFQLGQGMPTIDWEEVMNDYLGVHLTRDGVANTRFTEPQVPDLYGWDCETTYWREWAFDDKEYLGDQL